MDEVLGHVLVVEDDEAVRQSLARALVFEGYRVVTAVDGLQGLDATHVEEPDVIIADVMMPRLDGLEMTRQLRAQHNAVPILLLTARHTVSDRVNGLDAGADDYLVKPFALDELLARLRSLLRRTTVSGGSAALQVGDLRVDPLARRVTRDGTEVHLTKTEFDLLELLAYNAGIVLERDTILERIWGFDFETSSNSLDVYIGYLRRKLEADGRSRLIHTVRGVGYVVRDT